MKQAKVVHKFGKAYVVNDATYIMGVQYILADHIAQRFQGCGTVLDACCGAGFMSIALARYVDHVIAVDNNPEHLTQAKQNAERAGVVQQLTFILGDILDEAVLRSVPRIDAAFLDPDWEKSGHTSNKHLHATRLSEMQPPADVLFQKINALTPVITLRLPKEIDESEPLRLPPHELEKISLDGKVKFYCAYFGTLACIVGNTEFQAVSVE